jgi:hypothetical protein
MNEGSVTRQYKRVIIASKALDRLFHVVADEETGSERTWPRVP